MTRSVEETASVYMVEAEAPSTAWYGVSIHLTQAEAEAACAEGQRITPFGVSNPEATVRLVSSRLRGEHKNGFALGSEEVVA